MTRVGDLRGGDLIIGCDGHMSKMDYQPDDLILFRSCLLRHAIAKINGTRTAIVLFSHQADIDYKWPEVQEPAYEKEHDLHQVRMERYRTEFT
jgi:hypothetical protein